MTGEVMTGQGKKTPTSKGVKQNHWADPKETFNVRKQVIPITVSPL